MTFKVIVQLPHFDRTFTIFSMYHTFILTLSGAWLSTRALILQCVCVYICASIDVSWPPTLMHIWLLQQTLECTC